MTRYLPLLAALFAIPALAQDATLAERIPQGQWTLAYQRTGEIKSLHLHHTEEGTSQTCIDQDPRTKILGWIGKKGCKISEERMDGEVYRMRGQCTLKWWPGSPIPVQVSLTPVDRSTFLIDIQTEGNSSLSYTEHTKGTYAGPCKPRKPASAPQQEKDQGSKS